MKLMDKQGRLFGKVHFFDLLIVLLLVVGIAGMALRFANPKAPAANLQTATYTFEAKSVQECVASSFHTGDTLYENGVAMGTVAAVEVKPYVSMEINSSGQMVMAEHPLYYTLTLTVTTDALLEKDGYYIGTQEILNGTTHDLGNGFALASGKVLEIRIG